MQHTNAFVVKWQTGRNGDTFHGLAIHGILVDTEKRCSLSARTLIFCLPREKFGKKGGLFPAPSKIFAIFIVVNYNK